MFLREGLAYGHLSNQEKDVYKIALRAFSSHAISFDCTQANRNVDLMKVIQAVIGDNPSVIYFNKSQLQIEESIFGKKIILTGIQLKPQLDKMKLSLDVSSNLIVSSLKANSHDDYSLLVKLSEYLQKNVRYDKDELQASMRGTSISPSSHNAYGALINGRAVCDGIASAFSLLAQKLGFECMVVIGKSMYTVAATVNHAWNVVRIHDKYYHIDVTWDARNYEELGELSYSYFALADGDIEYDHEWDKSSTPACIDSFFNYYHVNNLFAGNSDQLQAIIKMFGKTKNNAIRIKISRNINLPNNQGEYLVQMVLREVARFGMRIQASYSWNENTRCFFAKIIT